MVACARLVMPAGLQRRKTKVIWELASMDVLRRFHFLPRDPKDQHFGKKMSQEPQIGVIYDDIGRI